MKVRRYQITQVVLGCGGRHTHSKRMSGVVKAGLCCMIFILYQWHIHRLEPQQQEQYQYLADEPGIFIQNGRSLEYIMGKGKDTDMVNITYEAPDNSYLRAQQPFSVPIATLRHLGVPAHSFVELDEDVINSFVLVTGASASFMTKLRCSVKSVQKYLPNKKTLVYDLGLSADQVDEVRTWCNVEYRLFDFSKYPEHVGHLHIYAWKPLIMLDVLNTYPGAMWMDTSVYVTTSDLSTLFNDAVRTKGSVTLSATGHSIYAATSKGTTDYLPVDNMAAMTSQMWEATYLMYRTKELYAYVLVYMALCALEESCIAPQGSKRACTFRNKDHYSQHGGCHRYDQSIVNILLNNLHKQDSWAYYKTPGTDPVKVNRGACKVKADLTICKERDI